VIARWLRGLLVLPLGFAASDAVACINTYSFELKYALFSGRAERVKELTAQIEAEYRQSPDMEATNDLAVVRIIEGRYAEAIDLLRKLDKSHPDLGMTAANLGTALELNGDDVEALKWIREGYRRDPREHVGSEWVHVRILESKIALEKDPQWLDTHTVLGVQFGSEDLPRTPDPLPVDHTGRTRSISEAFAAAGYQLFERVLFVKPPDAVVADLARTSGDLGLLLRQSEGNKKGNGADRHYEMALKYGAKDRLLINRRMQVFERLSASAPAPVTTP